MLSIDNTLTASQLKSRIMNYADEVDSLKNYCINGNRLNIYSSVHTDKHTNYYEWVNTKIHLNNCKLCDYSIQEGHVVAGGTIINNKRYGTCITCKGSAEVGFIIETCSLNNNQEYDYINGLYYPKTTQVVDGILDLSYEDSLSYEKINKILPLISCLFLTSCNNSNDSSMYNYKEEENRTIVKDFSLDDARNCVRAYRYENYKTYNKSFGIDIYYYLGKNSANMGNIVLMEILTLIIKCMKHIIH